MPSPIHHRSLHVSPRFGNDLWSGTLAEPDADASDGPLRTLTAAQAAVRRIKQSMTAPEPVSLLPNKQNPAEPEPIEVILGGGFYRLDVPWRMETADSGFGFRGHFDGRTWPVIWRGAEGEDVTVSAGKRIENWQPARLNGRVAWRAQVPWLDAEDRFFRQLWIDGQRRTRARLPKSGTFRVAATPGATFDEIEWYRKGTRAFGFRPGDLSAQWSNIGAIEVQFRGLWLSPRVRLLAIDGDRRIARLDRDTCLCLGYAPGDGLDYIVENVIEALTEPGEWCLDPAARCVWYMPFPDETPDAVEAIAGGIEHVLELRNARFLRFENICFAHTEWREPAAEALGMPTGAVLVGGGCEAVTFERCRIEHVGGYGMQCADGVAEITFRNGAIRDLGGGGVAIGNGCRRCVVEGSEICDGGHLWLNGVGTRIGKSSGNAVRHCHIHDFRYSGIVVGATGGYAESNAYGNVIEWNSIHDLGKGELSDMGGVYLVGNAAGTRVRHNVIHDIRSLRYGGWAIYPDEGSSDLLIENNLCYNTDREVFHQHYGRNNLVRNNIFAYGGEAVLAYTRMEEHLGLTFEGNIFVARGTPIVQRVDSTRWRSDRTRFRGNLYWREDGNVRFDGGWRTLTTQPVKTRPDAEAPRFRPLPADGATTRALFVQGRDDTPVEDAGEFRFACRGSMLTVAGRFPGSSGPPGDGDMPKPWRHWGTHVEVFLKPFALAPAMVRFIVAAEGSDGADWHACERPEDFEWQRAASEGPTGWSASLTVSLTAIEAWIRRSCGIAETLSADWRCLCAVALPLATLDFDAWRGHSGDRTGVVADPLFADPHGGDFQLRPESPALALGFVPFACGADRCQRQARPVA